MLSADDAYSDSLARWTSLFFVGSRLIWKSSWTRSVIALVRVARHSGAWPSNDPRRGIYIFCNVRQLSLFTVGKATESNKCLLDWNRLGCRIVVEIDLASFVSYFRCRVFGNH